jgi:uncharacterized protein with HEPN domain
MRNISWTPSPRSDASRREVICELTRFCTMRRCVIYRLSLSEAAQNLPEPLQARCTGIPWREIHGFRNILVHDYLGDIDPATVAAVVDTHLQPLEDCVQELLAADQG